MRPGTVAAFLAVLVASSSLPVLAAEPWETPFTTDSAGLVAAASRLPAPKNAYAQILLREYRVSFDEKGDRTTVTREVVRILTHGGVEEWQTSTSPWRPWYEARPEIRARVLTPDRVNHPLDASTISEGGTWDSEELMDDTRVLRAPLPALVPGAILETETTVRQTQPYFEGGESGRFPLASSTPARKLRLVLDAPSSLPLRTLSRGGAPEPQVRTDHGRTIRTWETGPFEDRRHFEGNLPTDVAPWEEVDWSIGTSWQDIGRRYSEIVDRQIAAGPGMLEASKTGAPRVIAAELLAALRKDIRYTGLEFGQSSIVPHSPAETLHRGFGDCKDKATLLIASLRAAGIDAHAALVLAGSGEDVVRDLPGAGLFNHAIVYVGGKSPFWIDPTSETARAGELPASDQGRLALIASGKRSVLVRTPTAPSTANVERRSIDLAVPTYGYAHAHVVDEWTGTLEDGARSAALHETKEDRLKSATRQARGWLRVRDITSEDVVAPSDLSAPFRTALDATHCELAFAGDSDGWVTFGPSRAFEKLPWEARFAREAESTDDDDDGMTPLDDRPERTQPFVVDRPYVFEERVHAVFPTGFVVRDVPSNETKTAGTASFSATWAIAGTSLEATFRFDTGAGPLKPADLRALHDVVRDVSAKRWVVHLDRQAMLDLREGRIAEAVASLRALAAAHPADGEPHALLARAYLNAGFGEAARAEALRSVQLSPGSAWCRWNRAFILQHDLFGRVGRTGMDIPGAERELREALTLDGGRETAEVALATVLEYSNEGVHWADPGRLAQAIDVYQKAWERERKNGGRSDLTFRYANALLHAGKTAKLREVLEGRSRGNYEEPAWLAMLALEGRGADARDEAAHFSSDPQVRNWVLGSAALTLMSMRRYPEAAELLRGLPDTQPATTMLVEGLSKAKRHEDLRLDAKDPANAVRRMFIALADEKNAAPETFLVGDELTNWTEVAPVARAMIRGMANGATDVNLDAIVDVTLAATDLKVEAGRGAWRVRESIAGANTRAKFDCYVVTTKNGPRIFAASNELDRVGKAALDALAKHDLAAARQWLDWANDAAHGDEDLGTFSGPVFAHLWPRKDADENAIRAAAAVLMASGKRNAGTAVPVLEQVRASLPEADRVQVDRALVGALLIAHEYEKALPIARGLAASHSSEIAAQRLLTGSLLASKHWDEALASARARLAEDPNDLRALRELAAAQIGAGQTREGIATFRKILESAHATATDYNDAAWYSLLEAELPADALVNAHTASEKAGPGAAAELNTLAAVQAAAGKLADARDSLLRCMMLRGQDEPAGEDWYVWGRIAEQIGLEDAAHEAYAKVEKDEATGSAWDLAQRRTAAMGTAKK